MEVVNCVPWPLNVRPIRNDETRVPMLGPTTTHKTLPEVAAQHADGLTVIVFRPDRLRERVPALLRWSVVTGFEFAILRAIGSLGENLGATR